MQVAIGVVVTVARAVSVTERVWISVVAVLAVTETTAVSVVDVVDRTVDVTVEVWVTTTVVKGVSAVTVLGSTPTREQAETYFSKDEQAEAYAGKADDAKTARLFWAALTPAVTVTRFVCVDAVTVVCVVKSSVSVLTVVVSLVVKRSVSTSVVYVVGLTATVEVTVLVSGVTVTARYEEQSWTPCLVVKADATTARRQLSFLHLAATAPARANTAIVH